MIKLPNILICTIIAISASQIFAASVRKQKKCKVLISDVEGLVKGKIYKFSKDAIKTKIKIKKLTKKSAIGVINKKDCARDLVDAFYQPNPFMAVSKYMNSLAIFKMQLGVAVGSLPFNTQTSIAAQSFEVAIVGGYDLRLFGISTPIILGVKNSTLTAAFEDENGSIGIAGAHTAVRAGVGFYTNPIKVAGTNLAIGLELGVDQGVASSVEAKFASDADQGFPGGFEDADGKPLEEEINGKSTPGTGFFANLELNFEVGPMLIGGYAGIQQITQVIELEQPQPFRGKEDKVPQEEIKGENIFGFGGGLNLVWKF